ncbi:MAG TPA: hypothetical protein VFU93_03190 [Acidimicrobiales bacterium]|nr:hypothetical protein [Acidimicrobiales bacterium]
MTGVQLILGGVSGVALGVAITGLRWLLVHRLAAAPSIPPSAEVLEAGRRRTTTPLTDRRTR